MNTKRKAETLEICDTKSQKLQIDLLTTLPKDLIKIILLENDMDTKTFYNLRQVCKYLYHFIYENKEKICRKLLTLKTMDGIRDYMLYKRTGFVIIHESNTIGILYWNWNRGTRKNKYDFDVRYFDLLKREPDDSVDNYDAHIETIKYSGDWYCDPHKSYLYGSALWIDTSRQKHIDNAIRQIREKFDIYTRYGTKMKGCSHKNVWIFDKSGHSILVNINLLKLTHEMKIPLPRLVYANRFFCIEPGELIDNSYKAHPLYNAIPIL